MTGVPHDNPSIETVQATVDTRGPTDRRCVRFEEAGPIALDSVVYLVLDGDAYRVRFVEGREGPELRGAFDTPDLARTPGEGINRLREWLRDADLDPGRTVHCDVVSEGQRYGLRAPGERAVYRDPGAPDEGLQSIAEDL